MTADEVIAALQLAPHPEGGFYRETFRDPISIAGGRAVSTAIYFLLPAGVVSRWHRVDAAEIWHWYAGAPLDLSTGGDGAAPDQAAARTQVLGHDLAAGQRPQHVVSAQVWQQAASCGAWTLVGCTVAPGFEFSGFEMSEG